MIGIYSLPEEALGDFSAKAPDLLFLDVQMPGMNGIELANRVLAKNDKVRIVYLTAYSDYAVDAFEIEAIDYLLKPIKGEDITRVLKRLSKYAITSVTNSFIQEHPYKPHVQCFGCFEVFDKKNNIIKWPTKKTEEAFAYLLYNKGNYVSKWTLIDLLWPDMEEKKALNNLYSTIYRIKAVLQELPYHPHIDTINSGYILITDDLLSDMELFKMLENMGEKIESSSVANFEKIFSTYNSPLFGSRDYLWSIPYQERLASSYRTLYKKLIHYYQSQGDLEAIVRILRSFAQNHIEDEEMILKGVMALYANGASQHQMNAIVDWINRRLSEQDLPLLHINLKNNYKL